MERDRIGGAHHLGVLMHCGPEFLLQKIAGLLIAIFKQLIHRQDLILQRQIGGEVGGHDHQRRRLAGLLRRFGFDLGGVVVAGEDPAHFNILLRVVELLNDAGHLHGQLAVHRRREHEVYFLFRQRRAAQGKTEANRDYRKRFKHDYTPSINYAGSQHEKDAHRQAKSRSVATRLSPAPCRGGGG